MFGGLKLNKSSITAHKTIFPACIDVTYDIKIDPVISASYFGSTVLMRTLRLWDLCRVAEQSEQSELG